MSRHLAAILASTALLTLVGCVYEPDVQQGNILHSEQVSKIKKGMSVTAVEAILVHPVLTDMFYNNSMVYVYTFKRNHNSMKWKRLIIYFSQGAVTHYQWDNKIPSAPISKKL